MVSYLFARITAELINTASQMSFACDDNYVENKR